VKYISIIVENCIKYFKLPFLKDINYDDYNIFTNKEEEILLDSEIYSIDIDLMTSEGLFLTKKAVLYYINYIDNTAVRLANFIAQKNEIISAKLINKDYQFYSLRKIDLENLEIEQISPELKDNQYFLITAHKFGVLKVWSIPEYTLFINFDTMTEEILCFDTTPNDLKIACSYNTGLIRFFDLNKESFLGKYKSISGQPYKFMKYLPDGQFLYAVDMNNTIFLIKVEKYEPLLIQIHQLFNISGEIIEFRLNPTENYNKFLVNIQNVFLQVFNRKFTNILKNLSFDSSIPLFYVQDKFHPDEYLKSVNTNQSNDITRKFENFHFDFSPNSLEKSFVYILSEGRKLLLIRNYELHTINKVVNFSHSPINFFISPNCAYIVYLFKNYFKLSQLGSDTGIDFNLESTIKNVSVSLNGKILIIHSENSLFFYHISYN
jgi:hypothetical protein